jgi:NAD(P)-dependent dehydrogenase (short-subunit alcohol dehydrogenase family)
MSALKLLANKTVLVTGASRGIGHELACALGKQGAKLMLVAHPWHEQGLKKARAQAVSSCSALPSNQYA